MSCVPTTQYLDGFLDDILDKVKELEIQPHMEIRETCGKLMQRRQGLRVALRDTPAPAHRSDFVCSTLIKSRQRHEQQRSHRVVMGGGPSARFFHFLIENPPVTTPTHDLVMDLEIMLAHGQVHTIKPVVNPKRYLEGTTFPGRLHGKVALKVFPQREAIGWQARLKQRKNILILPQWGQTRFRVI